MDINESMPEKEFRFSEIRAIRKNYWYSVIALVFGVIVFPQFFFFKDTDLVRWLIVLVSFMLIFLGGLSYMRIRSLLLSGMAISSGGIRVFSPKKKFFASWDSVEKIQLQDWLAQGMAPRSKGKKPTRLGKRVKIKTAAGNFSFGVLEGQLEKSEYYKLEKFVEELLSHAPAEKIEKENDVTSSNDEAAKEGVDDNSPH